MPFEIFFAAPSIPSNSKNRKRISLKCSRENSFHLFSRRRFRDFVYTEFPAKYVGLMWLLPFPHLFDVNQKRFMIGQIFIGDVKKILVMVIVLLRFDHFPTSQR